MNEWKNSVYIIGTCTNICNDKRSVCIKHSTLDFKAKYAVIYCHKFTLQSPVSIKSFSQKIYNLNHNSCLPQCLVQL